MSETDIRDNSLQKKWKYLNGKKIPTKFYAESQTDVALCQRRGHV